MNDNTKSELGPPANRDSTAAERIELAAQARLEEIRAERSELDAKDAGKASNSSLSALGWVSGAGFAIAIIAMIVVATASSPGPFTVLFWPAMLTVGPTVGFLALVVYLATKAIITSKK